MPSYVWLSYPLDINGPRPPAIPGPELSTLYTIKDDDASVHILKTTSHIGTHVDTPCHVIEGAASIHDFSPAELIYTHPTVIDIEAADETVIMPEHLEPLAEKIGGADIALFRFGCGPVRAADREKYSKKCPGLGVEAARFIHDNFPKLRALGIDVPSLACIAYLDRTMACHNELLSGDGRKFLVIEEMNLDKDLSALREVRVNPWLVIGMDSAPCTVVGVIYNDKETANA